MLYIPQKSLFKCLDGGAAASIQLLLIMKSDNMKQLWKDSNLTHN
jgi:hypothetical protein